MSSKKRTTDQWNTRDSWTTDTYQTGSTQPPKHYNGIIAFLLGLVIFMCGISTALGLMNIKLFRQLSEQADTTGAAVAFAIEAAVEEPSVNEDAVAFPLGFVGQTVPDFWCLYQQIPHGIYILDVKEGSDAELMGVSPGDVMTALDGTPVSNTEELTQLLGVYADGERVRITLCRDGQHIDLDVLKNKE